MVGIICAEVELRVHFCLCGFLCAAPPSCDSCKARGFVISTRIADVPQPSLTEASGHTLLQIASAVVNTLLISLSAAWVKSH